MFRCALGRYALVQTWCPVIAHTVIAYTVALPGLARFGNDAGKRSLSQASAVFLFADVYNLV